MEQIKRNIEGLRERLKTESNPQARWALQRQLFQEVYRIGFRRDLTDVIDREISEWKNWISRQEAVVKRLKNNDRESEPARNLLLLAQQTLAVHEVHRRRILMILAVLDMPRKGGSSRRGDRRRKASESESMSVCGVAPSDEDGA